MRNPKEILERFESMNEQANKNTRREFSKKKRKRQKAWTREEKNIFLARRNELAWVMSGQMKFRVWVTSVDMWVSTDGAFTRSMGRAGLFSLHDALELVTYMEKEGMVAMLDPKENQRDKPQELVWGRLRQAIQDED